MTWSPTRPGRSTERTAPLAKLMASGVILDLGERLHIDPMQISADDPGHADVPRALTEPDNERRADELLKAARSVPPRGPGAPGPPAPRHLRAGAQRGRGHEPRGRVDRRPQHIRARPGPRGARSLATTVAPHPARRRARRRGRRDRSVAIAALTFLVVFGACCGPAALLAAIRRGWRGGRGDRRGSGRGRGRVTRLRSAPLLATPRPRPASRRLAAHDPAAAVDDRGLHRHALARPLRSGRAQRFASDRPEARPPRPAGVRAHWVVALEAAGPATGVRFTPIHAGIAGFAAVAGISVVLNAQELDQTLVFGLSVKKLSLLAPYLSFFAIVASAVRPAEVQSSSSRSWVCRWSARSA